MTQLVYDGSFEGFLTAVFEAYERKLQVQLITTQNHQPSLYGERIKIVVDADKAARVWNGLKQKLSPLRCNEVYTTFLSERPPMEEVLMSFIQHIFANEKSIENDYGHKAVLAVTQIAKQVHREKHRMEAFVRFQRTQEDVYYATIEPDFNVLPLIASHFKNRYADQHWLIYDRKRGHGIHYDKNTEAVIEVKLELTPESEHEFLSTSIVTEDEPMYQLLWKEYFGAVNIESRKNTKLHVRHVPIRYWKYLTEKR